MTDPDLQPDSAATRTFACLRVSGAELALDAAQIREVVRYRAPTPLPGAPELIEGVLDLRGALVPIVDLARALAPAAGAAAPARIAVVEVQGHLLGLAVQEAFSVLAVPAGALESAPEIATRGGGELVCELIRRAQAEPLPVLSLDALLARIARPGTQELAA